MQASFLDWPHKCFAALPTNNVLWHTKKAGIYKNRQLPARSQSSGAVWKSRWASWAPVPNKPTVSVDVKQHFNQPARRPFGPAMFLCSVTKDTGTGSLLQPFSSTHGHIYPCPYDLNILSDPSSYLSAGASSCAAIFLHSFPALGGGWQLQLESGGWQPLPCGRPFQLPPYSYYINVLREIRLASSSGWG